MNGKRPNIIFVFSDQQRADSCGCYGQKMDITPNLDKMAEEGVIFDNAFTCQPICGPARAAIMTGKYPTETNNYVNKKCIPMNEKTIAHYLSEAGYEVGYIGKWHLASHSGKEGPGQAVLDCDIDPVPPERRGGFKDYWLASDTLEYTSHGYDGHMFDIDGNKKEFPEGKYRVDAQTDWVLDYLESRGRQRPFFLFVSYLEPHHQNDHDHFEGPRGSKEKFKGFEVPGDLNGAGGDWKEEYADYLGCVNSLDHNLGKIIDKVEGLGIKDETVIIYTSDHGCHFKTRNSEYKRSCHEASIKIPMVISGVGFTGNKRIKDIVSLIDIPPALLNIAGIEIPPHMQGRKLQDIISGNCPGWPEDAFIQISESQIGRAIRTQRWKYSVKAPGLKDYQNMDNKNSPIYIEDFLYDLKNDPNERNNLVEDPKYSDIRENLKNILLRRIKEKENQEPDIRVHNNGSK